MKLFVLFTLWYLTLVVFLFSFFPFKAAVFSQPRTVHTIEPVSSNSTNYADKLVLMVVDAMRYDFIPDMPYTTKLLYESKACLVPVKADAPTVTMPRIKALLTGAVSNYVDVVLNFGSSKLNQDNIIDQALRKGLKINFYGDDTWCKLFPNAFMRTEGVTSFFASDFTQVDLNVTRNVEKELQKFDWDILIMHYLGLDHIGHIEGPFSSKVKPKLKEMDHIVQLIMEYLEKDKLKRFLFIMTADHGMKDSGGHGGVTPSETIVPVVSFGRKCMTFPSSFTKDMSAQVDVASTLSFLLGLPIPAENTGKLIPELLQDVNILDILNFMNYNKHQLLHKLESFEDQKTYKSYSNWDQLNESSIKYFHSEFHELEELSQARVSANTDFCVTFLYCLNFIQWVITFSCVCEVLRPVVPLNKIHQFLIAGSVLQILSLTSSSFIEEEHQIWYFLWTTFCLLNILTSDFKSDNFYQWIFIVFIHRVLRKLNQTGDKWAAQPDISDYLISDEGRIYHVLLFLSAILLLMLYFYTEDSSLLNTLTTSTALVCIVMYKLAINSFPVPEINFYKHSRGSTEVSLFLWTLYLVIGRVLWTRKNYHFPVLLLSALIFRPYNTILLPAQIYFSKTIQKSNASHTMESWKTLAHTWLGYLFYFYQGNSNSISSIDVAAGYAGLESYNPVYVGSLLLFHTYSSHILSFLLVMPTQIDIYVLSHIIPVTFYCFLMILQRHHLFIWSVFSPKFLFEFSHTTVTYCCILLLCCFKLERKFYCYICFVLFTCR